MARMAVVVARRRAVIESFILTMVVGVKVFAIQEEELTDDVVKTCRKRREIYLFLGVGK
jgi:uncharacterized membrane protein